MKERFVQLVIADKTRILTLLVSFALGLTVTIASRFFGIQISEERSAEITLFCTLIFGWLIEAYASEVNAYGAERVQMSLQAVDKSIQVDRFIGPNTIGVTDNVVAYAEAAGADGYVPKKFQQQIKSKPKSKTPVQRVIEAKKTGPPKPQQSRPKKAPSKRR